MLTRISKTIGVALLSLQLGCAMAVPRFADTAATGGAEAPPMEPAADLGGLALGARGPMMQSAPAPVAPLPPPPPGGNDAPPPAEQAPSGQPQSLRAPMLVYTATMRLSVLQVAEASKQVETMTREVGGFLARRDDTSIVIRVPAAKFQDVLLRIEKLGDVVARNVEAEDVTEQFLDVETRLKSARAVRDRLAQLLEKATKVEDSLAIERELARITVEIETLESKLKYLRDRIAFSTITVTFEAKRSDLVKPTVRMPVDWLDQLGLGRLLSL